MCDCIVIAVQKSCIHASAVAVFVEWWIVVFVDIVNSNSCVGIDSYSACASGKLDDYYCNTEIILAIIEYHVRFNVFHMRWKHDKL